MSAAPDEPPRAADVPEAVLRAIDNASIASSLLIAPEIFAAQGSDGERFDAAASAHKALLAAIATALREARADHERLLIGHSLALRSLETIRRDLVPLFPDAEDEDDLSAFAAQRIRGLEAALREAKEQGAADTPRLKADAARWQYVRRGLFLTPHSDGEITVVFQSGTLDEFAAKLYPGLPKTARGLVRDVTPVIDAARAAAPEPPVTREDGR